MVDFTNIQKTSGLSATQFKRIGRRDVIPSNVQSRYLSNFIYKSTNGSASTTMNNGDQVVVTYYLTQNSGYDLQGLAYIETFVGTATDDNHLPGGNSIDESQWQVIGPSYSKIYWDDGGNRADQDVLLLYVRNISAGSQTVIFNATWKYISPREGGTLT